MFKQLEKSEAYTKEVLEEEYVPFMDAIPEIKLFMEELKAKEALLPEVKEETEEEKMEREKGEKKVKVNKYLDKR